MSRKEWKRKVATLAVVALMSSNLTSVSQVYAEGTSATSYGVTSLNTDAQKGADFTYKSDDDANVPAAGARGAAEDVSGNSTDDIAIGSGDDTTGTEGSGNKPESADATEGSGNTSETTGDVTVGSGDTSETTGTSDITEGSTGSSEGNDGKETTAAAGTDETTASGDIDETTGNITEGEASSEAAGGNAGNGVAGAVTESTNAEETTLAETTIAETTVPATTVAETDAYCDVDIRMNIVDEFGDEIADKYTNMKLPIFAGVLALDDTSKPPVKRVETSFLFFFKKISYTYQEATIDDAVVKGLKRVCVGEDDADQKLYNYYYTTDGEEWILIDSDTVITLVYTTGSAEQYVATSSDGRVKVTAATQKVGALPAGVHLTVTPITVDDTDYNYDAYMDALNEDTSDEELTEQNTLLYDIAFMGEKVDENGETVLDDDGEPVMMEYEPSEGSVSVTMEFLDSTLTDELGAANASEIEVKHLPLVEDVRESVESTKDATDITADDIKVEKVSASVDLVEGSTDTVKAKLDSFSVIALFKKGKMAGETIPEGWKNLYDMGMVVAEDTKIETSKDGEHWVTINKTGSNTATIGDDLRLALAWKELNPPVITPSSTFYYVLPENLNWDEIPDVDKGIMAYKKAADGTSTPIKVGELSIDKYKIDSTDRDVLVIAYDYGATEYADETFIEGGCELNAKITDIGVNKTGGNDIEYTFPGIRTTSDKVTIHVNPKPESVSLEKDYTLDPVTGKASFSILVSALGEHKNVTITDLVKDATKIKIDVHSVKIYTSTASDAPEATSEMAYVDEHAKGFTVNISSIGDNDAGFDDDPVIWRIEYSASFPDFEKHNAIFDQDKWNLNTAYANAVSATEGSSATLSEVSVGVKGTEVTKNYATSSTAGETFVNWEIDVTAPLLNDGVHTYYGSVAGVNLKDTLRVDASMGPEYKAVTDFKVYKKASGSDTYTEVTAEELHNLKLDVDAWDTLSFEDGYTFPTSSTAGYDYRIAYKTLYPTDTEDGFTTAGVKNTVEYGGNWSDTKEVVTNRVVGVNKKCITDYGEGAHDVIEWQGTINIPEGTELTELKYEDKLPADSYLKDDIVISYSGKTSSTIEPAGYTIEKNPSLGHTTDFSIKFTNPSSGKVVGPLDITITYKTQLENLPTHGGHDPGGNETVKKKYENQATLSANFGSGVKSTDVKASYTYVRYSKLNKKIEYYYTGAEGSGKNNGNITWILEVGTCSDAEPVKLDDTLPNSMTYAGHLTVNTKSDFSGEGDLAGHIKATTNESGVIFEFDDYLVMLNKTHRIYIKYDTLLNDSDPDGKVDDTFPSDKKNHYVNSVDLWFGDTLDSTASASVCVEEKITLVDKTKLDFHFGTPIEYSVDVNTAGLTLNGGLPLQLSDEMGDHLLLDKKSIKFYKLDGTEITGTELENYTYTIDSAHKFSVTVPDETPVTIKYSANYNQMPDDEGDLVADAPNTENTVGLTFSGHTQESTIDRIYTGNYHVTGWSDWYKKYTPKVSIHKSDSEECDLPGAKLQLYKYSYASGVVSGESTVSDALTSQNDGFLYFDEDINKSLVKDTIYAVKEHQAPDGYALAKPLFFVFEASKDFGDTVKYEGVEYPLIKNEEFIEVVDNYAETKYLKVDAEGSALAGATLSILEGISGTDHAKTVTGSTIPSWTSGTDAHVIEGLKDGTYRLHEDATPDGYATASDIVFIVEGGKIKSYGGTDGTATVMTAADDNILKMTDLYTTTKYLKVDKFGNPVKEAKLSILKGTSGTEIAKDVTGAEIPTWTSDTLAHSVDGLASGTYRLHENDAPDGYATASDIVFIVDEGKIKSYGGTDGTATVMTAADGNTLKMKDLFTTTNYQKVDEDGNPVKGAKLSILNADGTAAETAPHGSVLQWESGTGAHVIEGLKPGAYILRETDTPVGYALAKDIKFTLGADGEISSYVDESGDTVSVTDNKIDMTDDAISFVVNKKNSAGTAELKGALIQILEKDGTTQVTATEDIRYKEDVKDEADNVIHHKGDLIFAMGAPIEWTSVQGETFDFGSALKAGETYVLHEKIAPSGYSKIDDKKFTVADDGSINIVWASDATEYDKKELVLNEDGTYDVCDTPYSGGGGGSSGGGGGGITPPTTPHGPGVPETTPAATETTPAESETTPDETTPDETTTTYYNEDGHEVPPDFPGEVYDKDGRMVRGAKRGYNKDGTPIVKAAERKRTANTGDQSHMMVYGIGALIAAAGIALWLLTARRKKEEDSDKNDDSNNTGNSDTNS